MIKAIIFDLDMCILDTHSLSGPFFQPVLDVLWRANLSEDLKKKVEQQLWTTSLDDTAKLFELSQNLTEQMREAYRTVQVPDGIKTFGDEECIRDLAVVKILVTSGFRKFQESKVDKIGVRNLFSEVIVDALDVPHERIGKKAIFGNLLSKYDWRKEEVLVVGDNPHSELRAAKELGIASVQTLRPTVVKWDEADYHIESLCELQKLLA